MWPRRILFTIGFVICIFTIITILAKKADPKEKPDWAKKDIRDFSDADLERLLDQWEEDEEPLEPDELPEHLRPQPSIDFNKMKGFDANNPEEIMKMTKKGRTLMVFVSVIGNPSRDHTEHLTKLWQGSLWNNHIQSDRFMIDDNRAIFMFKDGSVAWAAKDFLIEQDECKEVTIEGKSYYGKNYKPPDDSAKSTPTVEKKKPKKSVEEL